MQTIVLVIPCYNEAKRLNQEEFLRLLESPDISLLFVNDGSTDSTLDMLTQFVKKAPDRMSLLSLPKNQGKGEAVRQGMLKAIQSKAKIVAYVDADLATPVDEILRLSSVARESAADVILGSRISYLGNNIDRSLGRHLLGRVFATAASLALETPVYDTQCGAKFFKVSKALGYSLDSPFHSKWAFDVELIGRLLAEGAQIIELPLRKWSDVPGSKIGLKSMLKAGLDLARVRSHLRKHRK